MSNAEHNTRMARAAEGGAEKAEFVREVFSTIAPRYDLLNHLLSLNIDKRWRQRAIDEMQIERNPRGRYLDLCAGTMDVSLAITGVANFRGSIVSADFAEPMLVAGKSKIAGKNVHPVAGDALHLPLADGSIAGAIVAFGIRNVSNLDAALREAHRVLESGGRFVILEFSVPPSTLVNFAYQKYFRYVLPVVGGIISGNREAYEYLPRSVANFPVTEELARRMRAAGFRDVSWKSLSFGIAAVHVAVK